MVSTRLPRESRRVTCPVRQTASAARATDAFLMNLAKQGAVRAGRVVRTVCAGWAAAMLATVLAPAAENPVVGAAQRELRRQQFYTGEISNTVDDATREAARRFQIRRGLKVTGELDGPTLAALAAPDAPAGAVSSDPQAGEERPPARERSQSIVRDDLDILRELEAEGSAHPPGLTRNGSPRIAPPRSTSAAPATAGDSATAPAEGLRPPRVSSREEHSASRTTETTPPRETIPPQQNYGPTGEITTERNPPSTARREPPLRGTVGREVATGDSTVAPQQEGIARGEILETVNRFVQSWQQPTPDAELSFYADTVNYFDEGKTAHSAIARDQRKYYQRWPERDYSLLSKPEVVRAENDSATVRYRFRYELRNGPKSARGRAEHFVRFERDGDGFKVVSLRERKITD